MNRYLSDMHIRAYRGLRDVRISNIGNINVIVGDNNSGKTSVLEAIRISCLPHNINNIAYVARQRDVASPFFYRASSYGSLLSALVKRGDQYYLDIEAFIKDEVSSIKLNGHVERTILNPDEMEALSSNQKRNMPSEEIDVLTGEIYSVFPQQNRQLEFYEREVSYFEFHKYKRIQGTLSRSSSIKYISPIDHITSNFPLPSIRQKDAYYYTIELLKLFDPDVVDVRIDVDDDTNKRVMFIENKRNGFIPLSSYGDGTKKVVLFASTIASMDGGILLIDEFESSIHTKAMDNVFKFLIEVCQRNHIQLFLTTHSQEALDKIIQCCQGRSNLLKIIMLDNDSDRTYARVIDGQKAFNLRFRNNAELR